MQMTELKTGILLLLLLSGFTIITEEKNGIDNVEGKFDFFSAIKKVISIQPVKPLDVIFNGGLQAYINKLPTLPNWLPAGFTRRGPYIWGCNCFRNFGGCYIDAAKPPGPGFTCKCVKAEDWVTKRNYTCVGLTYRLALDEKNTGGTYDLQQCLNGAKSSVPFDGDCGGYIDNFSDYEWNKVREDVKIRLFAPNTFHQGEKNPKSGESQCNIWEQGKDIDCRLIGKESIIDLPHWPHEFNPNLPVKGFIHGFSDNARFRSEAVAAYNKKFSGNVNVILFDWSHLAKALKSDDTLDNNFYYRAARNVPIVGEYLGRCLAVLSKVTGLRGHNIHITGHSLGGQMLGRLGQAYHWWVQYLTHGGEKLGRLTALDPAGPGFVDGDTTVDPRLHEERLQASAAIFVDVIHTNAVQEGPLIPNLNNLFKPKLGEYGPNGHYDFYVDGGDLQHRCNPNWQPYEICSLGCSQCSHFRAYQYFIDSINDDCNFPANITDGRIVCMGERAIESWTGTKYEIDVYSDDWFRLHRMGPLDDCKVTLSFACHVFVNMYPHLLDFRVCTKVYNSKCGNYDVTV